MAAQGEVSLSFDATPGVAGAPLHHRRGMNGGGPPLGGPQFLRPDMLAGSFYPPPPTGQISGYGIGPEGVVRFDDEPPLLEELGINIPLILEKTFSILNPFRLNASLNEDGDLSGPVMFCALFGTTLLLSGKVRFGVILGWAFALSFTLYTVSNLVSGAGAFGGQNIGFDLYRTCSLVGYSLIPMVLFSSLSLIWTSGTVANGIMAGLAFLWCTGTCSTLLVRGLPHIDDCKWLVTYAVALVYGAFALLVVY